MKNFHLSPGHALSNLAKAKKEFITLFSHGTLTVEIYKPDQLDKQQPHDRDEVYVIVAGSGHFIRGKETVAFNPGDFLFVPAEMEHRFVDFTDDFSTWVLFYGPVGGE